MATARNYHLACSFRPTKEGSLKLGIHNPIQKQECRTLTCMSCWRTLPLYTSEGVLTTTWLSNYIIHNEECGRIVTNNTRNLPYIVSYYRTSFTVSIFYRALFEANHLTDGALVEACR